MPSDSLQSSRGIVDPVEDADAGGALNEQQAGMSLAGQHTPTLNSSPQYLQLDTLTDTNFSPHARADVLIINVLHRPHLAYDCG